MEVKRVFMWLVEWVKKWNVWKLETDAFKKPIELEIHYDNSELVRFTADIEWLTKAIAKCNERIDRLQSELNSLKDKQEHLLEWYIHQSSNMSELADNISQNKSEIDGVYKEIWNVKNTLENQSGITLHLKDQFNEIEKKITKQPIVFHDKMFVSWREWVVLNTIDVPAWEYLYISQFIIWEHNEYVENNDEILFDKINVTDWLDVRYQLYWGTELDKPTATIYYNLILMPM